MTEKKDLDVTVDVETNNADENNNVPVEKFEEFFTIVNQTLSERKDSSEVIKYLENLTDHEKLFIVKSLIKIITDSDEFITVLLNFIGIPLVTKANIPQEQTIDYVILNSEKELLAAFCITGIIFINRTKFLEESINKIENITENFQQQNNNKQ